MIGDYFNTLIAIGTYAEGSAPAYEAGYTLGEEFFVFIDRTSSNRVWTEKGATVKIDAKMFCNYGTAVTENDRIIAIAEHTIAAADVGGYHKALGGAWTLTASAAIGGACIFYGATDATGTARKVDGDTYSIYNVADPANLHRHLELQLQRVK